MMGCSFSLAIKKTLYLMLTFIFYFVYQFSSEIMITGYAIFITFMTVGITSFLRHKIKYRLFYIVHHVVFAAYILTIMHTIDVVERKQGGRSQAYKWFSASILLYICDRSAMYLYHRYFTNVVNVHAIDSEMENGRLVVLKVRKPELLHFSPGQYLYLKIPMIDNYWHPFSIGSSPESRTLDFYIEVHSEESWSGRLFQAIRDEERVWDKSLGRCEDIPMAYDSSRISVEVLGPYGTALGNKMNFTHAVAIGTGTGVVPCLSALQDHVHQCLSLHPTHYGQDARNTKMLLEALEHNGCTNDSAIYKSQRTGSTKTNTSKTLPEDSVPAPIDLNTITQSTQIGQDATKAKRRIMAHIAFLLAPAFGVVMLGLTLSWNHLSFETYDEMTTFLHIGYMTFVCIFLLSTIFQSQSKGFLFLLDLTILAISIIVDWFWHLKDLWGNFDDKALVFYCMLVLYMTLRLWNRSLQDAAYNPVHDANIRRSGLVIYEKFTFVWSCRSAECIAQVYPDILHQWDNLVSRWGIEQAKQRCEIHIHCTDHDKEACQELVDEIQYSSLYREGAIRFGRLSIPSLVEKDTMEIMETKNASRTLLVYCGSGALGNIVKEAKVFNDLFLSMAGKLLHSTDIVIKTYGPAGGKTRKSNEATARAFTVTPNPRRKNGDEVRMSCSEDSGFATHIPIKFRSVASYNSAYERIRSNVYYRDARNEVHTLMREAPSLLT